MDHRPYEDWLLSDERLTPDQDRDLRVHLRNCPECAALSRANLALRSAPVTTAPGGFALRFQTRLVMERKVQRQRSIIGIFLLGLASLALLAWVLFPYLPLLSLPPAQIVSLWVNNVTYLLLTARTLGLVGNTLLNVLASSIPAYSWVLALVFLGVFGSLWTISVRRVGKYAQTAA